MWDHTPPVDDPAHSTCDICARRRLAHARIASEAQTIATLNAENIVLRDELERLRLKFEASQLALGVAVNEIEKVTGERNRARDLAVRSGVFESAGGLMYALSEEEL